MNNEITYRIINNQQVVELPLETLVKLEYILYSDSTKYYNLINIISKTIQTEEALPVKIFNRIMERVNIIAEIDERIGYIDNSRLENKEFEKFIKEANDAKKEYKLRKEEFRKKANEKAFIDSVYNICKKEQDFYTFRELSKAKDDLEKNLSYFCSKEEVRYLTVDYKRAYDNEDIEGMKKILNLAQKKIIKHWQDYLNDNSQKIRFIGHSVGTYDITGEFQSSYVSCSLFTEELLDTFHNKYGFKISPKNIISASSNDLYINNRAERDEDIDYSITKKIYPPERIIEECLKELKENKEEGYEERKVYSEVVTKGFEPFELFCLTNGAKELDPNYQEVLKLQKNYPNLSIDYIDISNILTGKRLIELKKELIRNIREKLISEKQLSSNLTYVYLNITDDMVLDYDYFFKKFQDLKYEKDYTTKDIIDIYKRNEELLSKLTIDDNTINNLNNEELEVLLKNNYKLRLRKIEEKKYSYYDLLIISNDLSNIKSERVDIVIPGLLRFINLFPKVPVKDIELQEYLCNSNNFIEINEKLEKILLITKNDHINILDKYNLEIETLEKGISEKQEIINQIKHNDQILEQESIYNLVKLEEKQKLLEQKSLLEQLKSTTKELNEIELEENKSEPKTKFFFFKRKAKKTNYHKDNLRKNQETIKEKIEQIDKEIEKMKVSFLDLTKIEYSLYEEVLKQAKTFNNSNNRVIINYEIDELKNNLDILKSKKNNLENKITKINEILGRKEEIDELDKEEKAMKDNINYRHMM